MATGRKGWVIGCLVYGVVMFIGMFCALGPFFSAFFVPQQEGGDPLARMGASLGMVAVWWLAWIAGSIPGFILLAQKKYLAQATSTLLFLGLVAWWLPLVLGAIIWAIALLLPARRNCPACNQIISATAIRCPHCTAEVTPIT